MSHQKGILKKRIIGAICVMLILAMSVSISVPVKAAGEEDNSTRYYLGTGKLVNAGNNDGFTGTDKVDEDDPHFGWQLGKFYAEGYTAAIHDEDGNPVFLKTVGDEVTLYFNLIQDIDKLKGDEDLKISDEDKGFDTEFGIEKTDFGRGTLIVRYTDYQNNAHDPVIYTNYLEATAKKDANTKIQACEEGDYEVALDYEVESPALIGHNYDEYRIAFKFSVRNGNSMVYPRDVKTGEELSNTSFTPNGFFLDLAKSRYLEIVIKKEVLMEGASGLTEDTRFNKITKDGDKYTEEGIYTITVKNNYTEETTSKKIYVGDNDILKAYVTTGLPISEIQYQVEHGATISENGVLNTVTINEDDDQNFVDEDVPEDVSSASGEPVEVSDESSENNGIDSNPVLWIGISAGAVIVLLIVIIAFAKSRKKKKAKKQKESGEKNSDND